MKYYVILLVTFKDGSKDKVAINTFATEGVDNQAKALAGGYAYLGQYVGADNVATINVEVKNNLGGVYLNEAWSAPVEPEPIEVPTEESVEE